MVFPPIFIRPNPGPIVTDDNPPFFSDRYDATTKWYFPKFSLRAPLLNSFTLKCHQSGVDLNAVRKFAGDASFVVTKTVPSAIQALTQVPGSVSYKEIELNGLAMSFTVTLFDNSTLPYPAQLTQNGADSTLTIKFDTQDSLIRFYKFISDPANKKFCSISITGTYFGYFPKAKPVQFNQFRTAFLNNHLQTLQVNRPFMAKFAPVNPTKFMPRLDGPQLQMNRIPVDPVPDDTAPSHPSDNPDNDYDIRETVPFSRIVDSVNFDCAVYPANYLLTAADGTVTAFGCKPPFGDASIARYTYSLFVLSKGSLGDRNYGITAIYRNTYNGNFLVIPERYVIALDKTEDEELLRPSAYLFTRIDPNDANGVNNSTATFQFNITTALSAFQLLLIKKLILGNLPVNLDRTVNDIFLEFPNKVHKVHNADSISFDPTHIPEVMISPMLAYPNGVSGSKYFNLQFQNVSIGSGSAAWVAMQLKNPHAGVMGSIAFDVDADSDPNPQSVIDLLLTRIAGNGLAVQTGDTGTALINKTLYSINLEAYQTMAGDEQALNTPLTLPANAAVSAVSAGIPADFSQVTLRYSFQAEMTFINQVLSEIRVVNLDTISDVVIVTNNTGLFSLFKIASIDFMISIIKPGETDPTKALRTACKNLIIDGAINNVPFILPVAQYLSRWSAVYSTVVNFQDGTQQINPAMLIEDLNSIGKLINLTVSKLNLKKS